MCGKLIHYKPDLSSIASTMWYFIHAFISFVVLTFDELNSLRIHKNEFVFSFVDTVRALMVEILKWKHFPRYWPSVRGIHRSPVNSPHKDQWRGALMFSFICASINGWVNNREADDLRRHLAHCDVSVMLLHIRQSPVYSAFLFRNISVQHQKS